MPRLDLLAIDDAVHEAVTTVVGTSEIAVLRHPGTFEEQGDEGRSAEILVGLTRVDVTTTEPTRSPVTQMLTTKRRNYELEFSLAARFYNYVTYTGAIALLSVLYQLDGWRVPAIPGADVLKFEQLEYEANDDGYWNYQGTLTLEIETEIPLVFSGKETTELRLLDDIPLELGVFAVPLTAATPNKDHPDVALDATIDLPESLA